MCDLYQMFVHVAYGCGSVLPRQGNEIPMKREGSFIPHWQCIVQHSISGPYKKGWTDRVGMMNVLGPGNKCVTWGWECPKGKVNSIFGETYPTSLIPLIIANWTGPYSGTQQEQTLDCKHWTSVVGRFCGWHRFSGPYSSMIFAMKDQFHLNLLIYLELVGWLEFNGAYLQT